MNTRTIPTVLILIGASGSGKTTYARKRAQAFESDHVFGEALTFSADAFPGLYPEPGRIDFSLLGAAHEACLRGFIEAIREDGESLLAIVDNTNTTTAEIAPYIAAARAYGIEPEVVHVTPQDMEPGRPLSARTIHGTPAHAIARQLTAVCDLLDAWPPFWPTVSEV